MGTECGKDPVMQVALLWGVSAHFLTAESIHIY